jgi:hypothetical protein
MNWWILTGASILLNLFFLWYVKELLFRFSYVSDRTNDFFASLENYREHLTSVYELPTFYGDSTIEGLIRHSKDIIEDVGVYKELFDISEQQNLSIEEEISNG